MQYQLYEQPNSVLYNTVFNATCTAIVIIIIYCLYVFFIFRYDPDRIGNLILVKYGAVNNKQLDPNGTNYFNYDNVVLSTDKKTAVCDMQIRDKETQHIQSSKRVVYKLTTNSSSCTLLDALTDCVVI